MKKFLFILLLFSSCLKSSDSNSNKPVPAVSKKFKVNEPLKVEATSDKIVIHRHVPLRLNVIADCVRDKLSTDALAYMVGGFLLISCNKERTNFKPTTINLVIRQSTDCKNPITIPLAEKWNLAKASYEYDTNENFTITIPSLPQEPT